MFSIPNDSSIVHMAMNFSPWIVILSVATAWIGSFTALSCTIRIGQNSLISKNIWLLFASISMTLGVWSMHFIGMAALDLPVMVSHNLWITILSLLPVMIATFLAFYFVNQPRKRLRLHILAGALMGIGISSMHYLGIYAMKLENVSHYYNPWILSLSIIISIIVSFIALYFFSNVHTYILFISSRVVTSLGLALAISSTHYCGMYAMKLYVAPLQTMAHVGMNEVDMVVLTSGVTVSIVLILVLLLATTFIDRYIENRIHYFDPLTKLPNRRIFQERIEKMSEVSAIAVWNFRDLESYNQEHGYLFVDRLISHLSKLLLLYLPPLTDLYRTQGNRFAYVANDEAAAKELYAKLHVLSEHLKEGIIFEGNEIILQGVCVYVPSENEHVNTLKKLYSNSLSVIKYPGTDNKLNIVQYNPKLHTRNFTEEIVADIDCAISLNHLFLVYQPKVDPKTNTVKSVEALIRWQHTKYGFLSPAVFLPIFEANNRMEDLTDWIIDKVCQQLKIWENMSGMPKQVAINIPGHYLTSSRLMKVLKTTIDLYNINADAIELEITETSFVKTIASAEKVVREFRTAGFSVALDDFGTGASSFSYLKKIPITTLKIDKSFIDDVPMSAKDTSIIKSMIQLGQSLKMKVVVEGVETKEQVDFLIRECDAPHIQGYYFAKPMNPDELLDWQQSFQLQLNV
ncbi:EAL domain-containing protein [Solibacillus sp. CAU 1738]|uniref:bifunctional diguanylate cyclase/phosphodiesterase n=1 Tax=Solibacillus sp. CAU 1738 TaxID=3140363 RepID=UPI0032614735